MSEFTQGIIDDIKKGLITPEEALNQAFPSPFIKIGDVSIDDLKVVPLKSGFKFLDDNFCFKKDRPDLVVIGADTSHGKSAFMLQIAANISATTPKPVFIFSLEMDERDIYTRLIAPLSNTPISKIKIGTANRDRLKEASKELKTLPMHVCTDGIGYIDHIVKSVYQGAAKYGAPELIAIDYLQLVTGGGDIRTYELGNILKTLKTLAKQFKCPILMGSQVTKAPSIRGKETQDHPNQNAHIPTLMELKDSSSIAHDADVVILLSRRVMYDGTRPNEADIVIGKNRGGKCDKTTFQFIGELCTFMEERDII